MNNRLFGRFFSWLFFIILLTGAGCGNDLPTAEKSAVQEPATPLPVVHIAVNSTLKSASIILALQCGFFRAQGLDVKLLLKQTGVDTQKALLEGEADLATVPEILAAYDTLQHDNWQIITSVNKSDANVLIGRKDRGVDSITSLRGKKIGLKRKSGSSYWLNRLLMYNSLSEDDVTLVDGSPGALVQMIQSGETDAVITWHPHAHKIQTLLADNAFSFSAQQGQDMYWVLLARRDWLAKNPQPAVAVIKALRASAQYITNNSIEAKAAIGQYLQMEQQYVDVEWPLHQFINELPQNLLQTMEEEVQWRLGQQNESQLKPDLGRYIYSDALATIDGDAVGIVR